MNRDEGGHPLKGSRSIQGQAMPRQGIDRHCFVDSLISALIFMEEKCIYAYH